MDKLKASSLLKTVFEALFSPPKPDTTDTLDYQGYMEQKRLKNNRQADRSSEMENTPIISIVIIGDGDAQLSIESAFKNAYTHMEVLYAQCGHAKQIKPEVLKGVKLMKKGSLPLKDFMASVRTAITGEYVLILNAGDILEPNAIADAAKELGDNPGADALYADSDEYSGTRRMNPHFKPDFSPDTLMSMNYIRSPLFVKTSVYDQMGGYNFDDYDYVLRVAEQSKNILHVPNVMVSQKQPTADTDSRAALSTRLKADGSEGYAANGMYEGSYRVRYSLSRSIKTSIIVPWCKDVNVLKRCLEAVEDVTLLEEYRLIVVAKTNPAPDERRYYNALTNGRAAKVIYQSGSVPAMLNAGANAANSDMLVFLSPYAEPVAPEWLNSLIELASQKHAGAVGGKLITPGKSIISCGLIMGLGGEMGSLYFNQPGALGDRIKNFYTNTIRNVSAVQYECMAIDSGKFASVKGFDESFSARGFDADLCVRLSERKLYNIYTPYALVTLHDMGGEKDEVDEDNRMRIKDNLGDLIKSGDPYYSNNFAMDSAIPKLILEDDMG